jgi:hypothetical protein
LAIAGELLLVGFFGQHFVTFSNITELLIQRRCVRRSDGGHQGQEPIRHILHIRNGLICQVSGKGWQSAGIFIVTVFLCMEPFSGPAMSPEVVPER